MASSMLGRMLSPPAYSEAPSPAQWSRLLSFSLFFCLVGIAIDVVIGLLLGGSKSIDAAALDTFLVVNLSLLTLNVVYYVVALRVGALRNTWTISASGVVVAATVIVWVQLTGTLTSYFIVFGVVLIPVYRGYVGFTAAACVATTLIVGHVGAVILEANGVLRARSLFLSTAGQEYELVGYRYVVMLSIAWIYAFSFLASNAIAKHIRQREQALAEVRREMARVAEDAKHGRLSGTVLRNEYALGELLGRGGMGEVYKARRISTDDLVAVKVLHSHLVDDDTILQRFRREAKLAERVPAEFTARVVEVGEDQEQSLYFIAMEYLRGEDLGAYLRRCDRLAMPELLALAAALAQAIDAAHAAGVVHRDLKPQNVLLVTTSETATDAKPFPYSIRLLDFGASKLASGHTQSLTQANALLGTPGFMAPEQALGHTSEVGPAADRFALAAILYRAVTGRRPFVGADLLATLRNVIATHPPAPSELVPGLHEDVDAVFAVGMAKHIGKRYDSAAQMVADLTDAARGQLSPATWRRASTLGGLAVTVLGGHPPEPGASEVEVIEDTLTDVGELPGGVQY